MECLLILFITCIMLFGMQGRTCVTVLLVHMTCDITIDVTSDISNKLNLVDCLTLAAMETSAESTVPG